MGKCLKRVMFCGFLVLAFYFGTVFSDRETLRRELIRLHVVANSDSSTDQSVKLQVRDAVVLSIQKDLENILDVETAKSYLTENIPKLQRIANQVLLDAGLEPNAVVTLCREAFETRVYETFTLPAGVYDALRVTIGEGAGKNWWCVAFPGLCIPSSKADFSEAAVEAGLSEGLTATLSESDRYEVRFFLLDALGRLENLVLG